MSAVESIARSPLGRQLWRMLPAFYREHDQTGDLSFTLDAFGCVLDDLHALLLQRLRDTSPRTCQDWLVPYFAELFHERLVSPDVAGQREEVARAIQWRKQKGSLRSVEALAESVLQTEVEVQEGLCRVAITPRVGQPLLPHIAFGLLPRPALSAADRARHPGLPAVTIDFRQRSRAVEIDPSVALVSAFCKESRFPPRPGSDAAMFGEPETRLWQQGAPRGIPRFPGSYQDVAPRTPDLRTPGLRAGHQHPRRVLVFARPPSGFFGSAPEVSLDALGPVAARVLRPAPGKRVTLRGPIDLSAYAALERIEDVNVLGELVLPARAEGKEVSLHRVAVQSLRAPCAVRVFDSLFEEIDVSGHVRLEFCTVLGDLVAEEVAASECIFMGRLRRWPAGDAESELPDIECVRFCRVDPEQLRRLRELGAPLHSNVTSRVTFIAPAGAFGALGSGVLDPDVPPEIAQGAEDRHELGAYHHRHHLTRLSAFAHKVESFLPVGQVAIVHYDPTLQCPPPREEQPL